MSRLAIGVAALALLGLAACGQKPGQQPNANGAWNNTAQNVQPQPWGAPPQGQPGMQQGMAPQGQGSIPAPWQGGGAPQPMAQGGGGLSVSGPPQGMRPIASQAGYVFMTQLNGTPRASQLLEALEQGVNGYFDGQPQILRTQIDPNDRIAQVAFQTSLHGAPVTGQIVVASDGRSGGVGFLMFDSPERTPQTMNAMIQAASQNTPRY